MKSHKIVWGGGVLPCAKNSPPKKMLALVGFSIFQKKNGSGEWTLDQQFSKKKNEIIVSHRGSSILKNQRIGQKIYLELGLL